MSKLSLRDKIILLVVAVALVIYGGYNFLYTPTNASIDSLNEQITTLKGQIGDTTPLDAKLKEFETQSSDVLKKINEIKSSEGTKSLNKQDFLVFLGNECSKNSVELVKFNDFGVKEETNGVWKMQLDFELRGSMTNLNKICENINKIGVKYSVGGMSLRQNNNYPYLARFFDDISKLEWYKDPTEPKTEDKILEELPPLINEFPPKIDFPQFIPPDTPIEMPIPTPVPTPDVLPTPTPEQKDENITDRIDKLLELTSHTPNYRVMLLNNNDISDIMRLNITVEFIMYADPKMGGSINNEIL